MSYEDEWFAYFELSSPETMMGVSSKLTLFAFFFAAMDETESLMPTSDDGFEENRTSGEAVRTDDEGECFSADLAGDADRFG